MGSDAVLLKVTMKYRYGHFSQHHFSVVAINESEGFRSRVEAPRSARPGPLSGPAAPPPRAVLSDSKPDRRFPAGGPPHPRLGPRECSWGPGKARCLRQSHLLRAAGEQGMHGAAGRGWTGNLRRNRNSAPQEGAARRGRRPDAAHQDASGAPRQRLGPRLRDRGPDRRGP